MGDGETILVMRKSCISSLSADCERQTAPGRFVGQVKVLECQWPNGKDPVDEGGDEPQYSFPQPDPLFKAELESPEGLDGNVQCGGAQ